MELLRQALLAVHLAVGTCALVLFWIPALTRKGSARHRAAGRWYVRAMAFMTASGIVLAQAFLFGDRWQTGVFLLFLGVITGTSLWNGWRVLRAKRDPGRYATAAHAAVALLNVLGGGALVALGLARHAPMLCAFGPVGFVIGGNMLALRWRRSGDPEYWLYEHFTGMIGSGIAAHVAFLAFGVRRLLGTGLGSSVYLWMAPVVIGTAAIVALNFHYRLKAAAVAPPPRAAA